MWLAILLFIFILSIVFLMGYFAKKLEEKSKSPNSEYEIEIRESLKTIQTERVAINDHSIQIKNTGIFLGQEIEIRPMIKLKQAIPEIFVYEDGQLICTYTIEPKTENPDLTGCFLHISIRANSNSTVQIDGIITKDETANLDTGEGIRFQPLFLSNKKEKNQKLKGKGMFERGLHYSGYITPRNTRLVCLCDDCKKSFSVGFYHAGFSEVQYFYSTNSKETLIVPYGAIPNLPTQLQKEIDENSLQKVEQQLPKSNDGEFRYYNSFKCPHCNSNYIDFEKYKYLRSSEYYLNFHLNQEPIRFKK